MSTQRKKDIDGNARSDLHPELLGVVGLNPFFFHNSSSRLQMYCTHLGQSLGCAGATIKRLQSGLEREFAKYTFNIKMPCNANILKVIHKYPKTYDNDAVKENPLSIVIYENMDKPNREIGIVEIPSHHCLHQYYGFRYNHRPVFSRLVPGESIAKDTILADSPLVTQNGDYKYGLEANVAMMSLHQNSEDGIIISRSFQKRLTTKGFGTRIISWGKNRYPLNLEGYGPPGQPKPFPDVGDRIRPDGLVFALREYDDYLAPVEMTPQALQSPIYNFDKLVYTEPEAQGNGRVIDVIVHKGAQPKSKLPGGLPDHAERYLQRIHRFYDDILAEYRSLQRKRGSTLVITPQFQRLIVEAIAARHSETILSKNESKETRITPTYKRVPIDEWMVEIVYEYDLVPDVGAKITDSHGGKGVVVQIWDDDRMPVDKFGNRAEVIVDDYSTVKRMNIGRLYEQFFNAVGWFITNRQLPMQLGSRSEAEVATAWSTLETFYRTVSPAHWQAVVDSGTIHRKLEHLEEVIRHGHYIYCPTDTPIDYSDAVATLMRIYPEIRGPVSYIDDTGRRITTMSPVLIGSMYLLLLEKTGGTQAAVSSAKLSHFGIPAKLSNDDRHSSPGKPQPIRIWGEAEIRLGAAACGGEVMADILDQSNNPIVHKEILNNILHSEKPFVIQKVVDRVKYPMGGGRMHLFMNHVLFCSGIRFVRGKRGC